MNQPLPFPLPYAPSALQPVISENTVMLHDQIAAGYAAKFPVIQAGVPAAVSQGELALREQLRTLSFQGSGYTLHNVYFSNMIAPGTGGTPGATTQSMVAQRFSSMNDFQKAFINAANAVEGPGWAVFGWLPATSSSYLLQCEEHNNKTIWGIIPILVLDVWEHAYILDYGATRAQYTTAWWSLINWQDVENRAIAAIQTGSMPMIAPPASAG